jgi:hypothetical protein
MDGVQINNFKYILFFGGLVICVPLAANDVKQSKKTLGKKDMTHLSLPQLQILQTLQ